MNCLGHSHDIHRFAGFVRGNSYDRLNVKLKISDRLHNVLRTFDVGANGLVGEVLTRRNLLQRRCIEDDVSLAADRCNAVEVANVANNELKSSLEVVKDDLVRGNPSLQIIHPHVVLLGLISAEDNHFLGGTRYSGKDPFGEGLPKRARPARNQDALAVE